MELTFYKVEGLGNDLVLLDDRDGKIEKQISYPDLAVKLCDRHFGIGGDGIMLILEPEELDIKFRIFNSDGSVAQMCGNGMRGFAKYLYEKKIVTKKRIRVETLAGEVIPEVLLDGDGHVSSVRVDMGEPELSCPEIPVDLDMETAMDIEIQVAGKKMTCTCVSMGNPHAVFFVPDIKKVMLESLGPVIENHPLFPEKTNVEFVQVLDAAHLRMRVWERGAGITLACGTGACAALVAAHLTGRSQADATVHLDGGDLNIFWDRETNHIMKTGPAQIVFKGCIHI